MIQVWTSVPKAATASKPLEIPFALRFALSDEREFEAVSHADRVRLLTLSTLLAAALFNGFLITDWFALNDRFWQMVILRTLIFTPFALACVWWAQRITTSWHLEALAALGAVLGVLLPMAALATSGTSYALSYQYGSLLTMMFLTVAQRVRFRFAVLATLLILAIQFVVAWWVGFDETEFNSIVMFFITAAAFLLLASYFAERGDRQAFLLLRQAQHLQAELQRVARLDPLTGLSNRRRLEEYVADLMSREEAGSGLAALLLDIDHFKLFNDTCGHLQGDQCLRAVSDCITTSVAVSRSETFRLGGEEMLVLMPGANTAEALEIGERIRDDLKALALPHPGLGGDKFVTVSIGIAVSPALEDFASLLGAADAAMYTAKRLGRNRVEIFAAPNIPASALC